MPDVEIRPFSDEHLDAAAEPLRERHERHLAAEPLLAREVDYRAQLAGEASSGDGVVALAGGEVHAYLLSRTTVTEAVVGTANSIDLALVVTAPDARGAGVGSALTTHALGCAHEAGYDAVTIDWRVVNLLASRLFGARDFRPTFVRLYRHIP
jgi:GNAT superfamily N-acetyltransferase